MTKRKAVRREVRRLISIFTRGVSSRLEAARVAGDEFLIGVTDRYDGVYIVVGDRTWFCHRVDSSQDFVDAATKLHEQHQAAIAKQEWPEDSPAPP